MNIDQIKSDLANNIIVSRETWHKLVEAAQLQQEVIRKAWEGSRQYCEGEMKNDLLACIKKVEAL